MKAGLFPTLALLACVGSSVSAVPAYRGASVASNRIVGDYVEARTASVFAGACHYNGELVTTGRDAIMAWNFMSGSFNGTDLSGVRAMAAVTSDASLGDNQAARKSELVIDPSASDKQVAALTSLLSSKTGKNIGVIVAVQRAPVAFKHEGGAYSVSVQGFAEMNVQAMPDDACCVQPNLVWYSPLTPLDHRKVGFTQEASFTGNLGDHWQRFEENGAFYGSFMF